MQVHPDVARLRGDGAPQPGCDAALSAWHGSPGGASVHAALAQYDAGQPPGDLPVLARIIADHAAAQAFAAGFIAPLIAALRAEPLAQLPLGHSAGPGMARLRLAEHGRAGLSLVAFARRERAVPLSALFEDCMVHEIVVAGEGRALLHRLDDSTLRSQELALEPGTRLVRDGPDAARQIIAVARPLLALQLTLEAARPGPSREIALDDGRLITAISGCKRASQQMMGLAVLGALEHRPALDAIERLARDGGAQRDLRWEALRQVLALDTVRGLALLAALAGAEGDTLSAPAAALGRQLRSSRPDLAELIAEPA
jgi:hypothetical protein